ncbi:hypothetical protein [Streptomyces botrytidirepellens]|nr:hypothetical protein [Streptomyces botrytidirepellens]
MAAIPGIAFDGNPGVVRGAVPGAGDRPDESYGSPMWPIAEGRASATPASRHVPFDARGAVLVARVWEALELPGSAMDYHFVLQGAVDRLWSGRRADPAGLELLEVFARLDLALMEAAPQAVSFDAADAPATFVRVTSVPRLIGLLEREGAFTEALELARRLAHFGQGEDVAARLSEKAGALVAEAAAGGGSA